MGLGLDYFTLSSERGWVALSRRYRPTAATEANTASPDVTSAEPDIVSLTASADGEE